MIRRLATLLVLLSIFWQAIAVAGHLPVLATPEEREHAVLHLQEADHHHDANGAVAQDHSSESKLHLLGDRVPGTPPVTVAPTIPSPQWENAAPGTAVLAPLPSPVLEGLRRPPRHPA
jgi:hypothetical protein